jgi:energy-coupling factor transporter ATP-binding protein EcfA2
MNIDRYIKDIDDVICENIDKQEHFSRGSLSRNILSQIRNFVEHVFIKLQNPSADIVPGYENIMGGVSFIKSNGRFKWLSHFHECLQESVSHYTPNKENSERLMLKYFLYLIKIKKLMKDSFNLEVLRNIEKFPLNQDKTLVEYYDKIADEIEGLRILPQTPTKTCYRIIKNKPFCAKGKVYFEVTFSNVQEKDNKFDRIIAFTNHEIMDNYEVNLSVIDSSISILNKEMPVKIITDWKVSIRPCEFKNLRKFFYPDTGNFGRNAAYEQWMGYLTRQKQTLIDVLELPDEQYESIKNKIWDDSGRQYKWLSDILDLCRPFIKQNLAGSNVIRFLLYSMNNDIIKSQFSNDKQCFRLSNLYLKFGCIPFDREPYFFSPIGHNARFFDLLECFGTENHEHELFARFIKNNIEVRGTLFTKIEDAQSYPNYRDLAQKHYACLWKGKDEKSGHIDQRILYDEKNITIKSYVDDAAYIVNQLQSLTDEGMLGYSEMCNDWLSSQVSEKIGDDKKAILPKLFEKSKVALIYGPAGTGKTTIIDFISQLFENYDKLFLAQTNPAVQNLQRRVSKSKSEFSTITKYLGNRQYSPYNIIVIDECSTVSNADMRNILKIGNFSYLVLVGDTYQIESIDFGNWFSLAPKFIPKRYCFELVVPYRTKNKCLLDVWNKVRNLDSDILEYLTAFGYSTKLDESIFSPTKENEIILCLNYDGLYGINNINRFMQANNLSLAVEWGDHIFKENDPILFKDNNRFKGLLYNNLKGRIHKIEKEKNKITFTIDVYRQLTELDANLYTLELISVEQGKSRIRFSVEKYESIEDDEDSSLMTIVPFQIAYAVSIHKAQGLEYDSVKIVVSSEVDEQVSHNIFYTAITRARQSLKIYWTPETEKHVLEKMEKKNIDRDAGLLKSRMGWKK